MAEWDFRPSQLDLYKGGGYDLIPLHAPDALDARGRKVGKAPHRGWRKDAPLTVDEALEHMASGCNVGVRLRPDDLVVDVDPRNFVLLPDGSKDDPLRRLQDDLGADFSAYPTVVTGSGGLHVYMKMPAGTLLRDTLEDYQGVEFKAHGRQVVSAGSAHPDTGRPYLLDDLSGTLSEPMQAPPQLVELTLRPGRVAAIDAGDVLPERLSEMLDGLDPTDYRDHSRWLELMMACHHATGGDGRDEFLEWSTSDPQYAKDAWIVGRRWDSLHADRAGRRITQKTLFKRLIDAGRQDLLPRDTAEDDFADELDTSGFTGDDERDLDEVRKRIEEEGGDPSIGQLEALNAKGYAVVNENGAFKVYRRKKDYTWPDGPRDYWEVQRKGDFFDLLANVRAQKIKGDTVTTVAVAQEWFKWGGRTQYDGVAFDPGGRIPDTARVLNLWTDWAVEPKRGDWSLLKRLLLEGLCDGDEAMYRYVLDWSAFMVQHPDRPAEVALIFRGQKGTGKGTYFRFLGELAGRHAMHISSQHHLTNHFNAHLRDCIFLFADEAMWAGDKRAEGTLKALITEPTIVVEQKGKDVITVKNQLHICMASNEDWVFPASMEDERRLAISDVNARFRGNAAFFTALHAQMREGGLAAMLFELKTRDLSDFHPRRSVPSTKALANQKLQSLDSFDSWWYESLCRGDLGTDAGPIMGDWRDSREAVWAIDDAREGLEQHLRKVGDRYFGRRSMDTMMGARLARRVVGGRIKKVRATCPDVRRDLKADASGRVYGYRLPNLADCRAMFEEQLGAKLPWDSLVLDQDVPPDLDMDVEDVDPLDETFT